jgi:hypothetical protein
MGAWGFKALESDEGLDVIDFLEALYNNKDKLILSQIISGLLNKGFLSPDMNEIDFFYDNTAMSLAELFLMFKEEGALNYDNEADNLSLRNKKFFEADKKSLEFILQYLIDIKNEKPEEDGTRETVELWRDSDSFEEWKVHLNYLIEGLNKELN